MSATILSNLIIFYSFLIIILSISLYFFIKTRKNTIKIALNSSLIYKILECYSINVSEFIDFVDHLIVDLHKYYICINKEAFRYDLFNYFILFLNGRNISSSKLNQYCVKYKRKSPLLYLIEKNFNLKRDKKSEKVIYYLISNRFSQFLNYSSWKELGVEYFEWEIPIKDKKVCSFCKSSCGKIFSWKEGSNGKIPGQNRCTINGFCRCTAKLVDLNGKNVEIIKNDDGSYSIKYIL